jgi:hypothetical protein
VMGGYSTSLYLGLALGSFALGPVITVAGHEVAFGLAGAAGGIGALAAAALWVSDRRTSSREPVRPPGSGSFDAPMTRNAESPTPAARS